MTSFVSDLSPRNEVSIACKRLMAQIVEDWLKADPTRSRKQLALALGVTPSDLSHWLTPKVRFTLPLDLIGPFCAATGNDDLIWFAFLHIKTLRYPGISLGMVQDENATARTVAPLQAVS